MVRLLLVKIVNILKHFNVSVSEHRHSQSFNNDGPVWAGDVNVYENQTTGYVFFNGITMYFFTSYCIFTINSCGSNEKYLRHFLILQTMQQQQLYTRPQM